MVANYLPQCQVYITYGNPSREEFKSSADNIQKNYILEDHYLILNTPDDYYNLNNKTIALLLAITNCFPNISGLFKCDDDIIPNIEHLTELITSSRLIDIDYCGNKVNMEREFIYNFNDNPDYPTIFPVVRYCGGPLYYLGSRALDTFKGNNTIKLFYAEDIMVGYHLNHVGIEPSNDVESLYSNFASNLDKVSFHNYKHEPKYLDMIKIPVPDLHLLLENSITRDTQHEQHAQHAQLIQKLIPLGILCPQINGGLGNQLFKLGASISLAREYNRELVISKVHFIPNNHQSADKTIKTLEKLFCKPICPLRVITSNIPGGHYVYKAGSTESFQYIDLSSRIPDDILKGHSNLMLDGYFINPRYLPADYPSLISIIPTRSIQDITTNYGVLDQTYFIHIRLGDYVNHELYRIPLESYYIDCITRIKNFNPNAHFLICTNEYSNNLVKYIEQISKITGYTIQSQNDDELDTLYVMSQCRGGICANSTLSWLGSYFQQSRINVSSSQEACKHIYMPYPWVNRTWHGFTDENTKDIFPEWATVYNTNTSAFL